jgi:CheY-like chemotaxis protein
LGYSADVANNGQEAVDALERASYDVILMDVQMPELDGLEATRRIRATVPSAMQPRIVAMTANAMQGDREECLEAGMDDYLSKPFRPEELIAILKKCRPLAVGKILQETHLEPALPSSVAATEAAKTEDSNGHIMEENGEKVSTDESPIFDPAGLQQLKEILGQKAEELLPSLLDNFFEEAPRLIEAARKGMENDQATDLRRAAHTLKSNSRDFGVLALAEVSRELETKAKAGVPEDAARLIEQLEQEFARAKPPLEDARERMLNGNT